MRQRRFVHGVWGPKSPVTYRKRLSEQRDSRQAVSAAGDCFRAGFCRNSKADATHIAAKSAFKPKTGPTPACNGGLGKQDSLAILTSTAITPECIAWARASSSLASAFSHHEFRLGCHRQTFAANV